MACVFPTQRVALTNQSEQVILPSNHIQPWIDFRYIFRAFERVNFVSCSDLHRCKREHSKIHYLQWNFVTLLEKMGGGEWRKKKWRFWVLGPYWDVCWNAKIRFFTKGSIMNKFLLNEKWMDDFLLLVENYSFTAAHSNALRSTWRNSSYWAEDKFSVTCVFFFEYSNFKKLFTFKIVVSLLVLNCIS